MHAIHTQRGGMALLLCLGILSAGCEEWWGEEEEDASTEPSVPGDGSVDASVDAAPAPNDASLPPPDAAPGADAGTPVADAALDATALPDAAPVTDASPLDAAPEAAAADAATEAAAPGTELPCDVAQVVKARCQACHGSPPTGAPIPLVTLADFKAMSSAGGFVYQRAQIRVDSATMPPSYSPTGVLTSTEKATLTTWLLAGAPGSNSVCP